MPANKSDSHKMCRLPFVLLIGVTITSGLKLSLRPRFLEGRIVGGQDANISDIPYQASIRFGTGNRYNHICGGSLISIKSIVTAGHCAYRRAARNFRVTIGSSSLQQGSIELLQVANVYVNPNYNPATIDYDVAVFILKNPVVLSPNIQPIELAEISPDPGTECVVSGWGYKQENSGIISDTLQRVDVNVISQDSCSNSYQNYLISDSMICAGVENGGKDACQGDSGGPLACGGLLVGVVSWGIGCAQAAYPGVYARISTQRAWICYAAGLSS